MNNKFLSFLGLAQRSGNLVTGEDTCEIYIKKRKIKLIIISEDASENTKKKFKNIANNKNIKIIIFEKKENLSSAIGKYNRTVYGIKDELFSKKLLSLIKGGNDCSNNLGGE